MLRMSEYMQRMQDDMLHMPDDLPPQTVRKLITIGKDDAVKLEELRKHFGLRSGNAVIRKLIRDRYRLQLKLGSE